MLHHRHYPDLVRQILVESVCAQVTGGALAAAEPAGAARLVRRVFVGRSPDELRRLATALVEAGGVVALLGLAGERSHLVFARSADAPGDMSALVKVALAKLGGRGGGSPTLAQGGGPAADEAAVAAVLQLEL